ncbi:LolA family protein [Pedobacter glucosidilyticus]|uniref:LolA family protein n=1 Tax=Pedobacter glucosidilyticus TaxID=1122941 RepID=UPI0026ED6483|nr:outer membrane lipoprotein carrier protein LolA [Pedobacter glucosidilyticus]
MLKLRISLLSAVLLFVFQYTFAQPDAKAKAILADVSKKFRSYNVVKAEFTYSYLNRQNNTRDNQKGTLYIQSKTNKFKAILPSQELISDGKVQWTYLKEDKEVQVSEIDNSPDALNPAQIFTIYEKGFKYVYTGDVKAGAKILHNIELAPLSNRSFSKIKLQIDKQSKQLYSFSVFDKNGNIYAYTIQSFTPNIKVPASLFTFEAAKYPGVEVVDLR